MANLTPSQGTCRVDGIWISGDHTKLRPGTFTVRYPRTRNSKQKAIVPAGVFATGPLNTDPGTPPTGDLDPIVGKSFSMDLPSTTDPDLRDAGKVQIDIAFGDGGASETYVLDLPEGGTIHLDELNPTIIGAIPAPSTSSLKLGKAGGVALLNDAGQVVDATGTPVTASGSGTVTAVAGVAPVSGNVPLAPADIGAASAASVASSISTLTTAVGTAQSAATAAASAASAAQTTATGAAASAATANTGLTSRVRTDVDTQGLNSTQQANARTNIGAAAAADLGGYQPAGDYALAADVASFEVTCTWTGTAWQKLGGGAVPTDPAVKRSYNSVGYTSGVTVPTFYANHDVWLPDPDMPRP